VELPCLWPVKFYLVEILFVRDCTYGEVIVSTAQRFGGHRRVGVEQSLSLICQASFLLIICLKVLRREEPTCEAATLRDVLE